MCTMNMKQLLLLLCVLVNMFTHATEEINKIDEKLIGKTLTNIYTKAQENLQEEEKCFTPGEYKIKKLQSAATATIELATTNDDIMQMYATGDIVYVVEVQELKKAKRIRGKLDNGFWISLQNTQNEAYWVKRLGKKIVEKPSQNVIKKTLANIYTKAKENFKRPPEDECMVCFQRFPVSLTFPCGHELCALCLELILMKCENNNCPQCRAPLPLLFTDWLAMINIYPCLITPEITLKDLQHAFPLICSVANLTTVTKCIKMGVDVNTTGFHGKFPLTSIAQINVVKYLVNKGADVKQSTTSGMTSLMINSQEGNLPVVKYLFKKGVFVDERALLLSSQNGHLHVVKFLVQKGAKLNKHFNSTLKGETALSKSSQNGHLKIVKYLIQNGAKANDPRGMNPVYGSSINGHLATVEYLVQNGADVNQPMDNDTGDTSLLASSQNGHLSVVQYLIEHGADVNLARNNGVTPLCMAIYYNKIEVAKFLLKKGANIETTKSCLKKDVMLHWVIDVLDELCKQMEE